MNKQFAVIGYPIGHTMSPFINSRLFELSGFAAEYKKIAVDPAVLAQTFGELENLSGFNVTIPHKQAIIPLLDRLDQSAALFGAVNTVFCGQQTVGYNTDSFGFLGALDSAGVPLEGSVLVCGAGGAARTIAITAASSGCDVTVAVRQSSLAAANALKAELNEKFGTDATVALLDEVSGSFELCVNATPVGMYPKTGVSPLTGEQIGRCKALFDAVYNPRETALMSLARERNVKVVGGMAMLVLQAAKAHEIWYGARFTRGEIAAVTRDANLEMERIFAPPAARNIVLCGFMGSGKSTVGKLLAARLGMDFADTDQYIVEREKMQISDIFSQRGEDCFRELEHAACAELAQRKNTVIATGGGALTFERNAQLFAGSDVFFLDVPFSVVRERVGNDPSRPLMSADAEKLFDLRRPLYIAAAKHTIDGTKPPEKIIENIIEMCKDGNK